MVKAVVFDLDDTLISEEDYISSGYRYISSLISKEFNMDSHEIYSLLMDLFNNSPQNVFNRLFDTLGISYTKNDIIELVGEYRNHTPDIMFFDDVLPCLEYLRIKCFKLGVITDGYANAQRKKLEAINATKFFDKIIVTDELGRDYWKPHPKAYELMKKSLNVEFDEMVYVGDNPEKDFFIGSTYPIKTIRIYREGFYTQRDYLNDVKEKHSIHTLRELKFFI